MGRYEVTVELGRGSMGIVHRAHDVVMGRDVALKTILIPHGLPQEQREEFQERFLREAQAAGRLSHPGIVTVYDFNRDSEEERPYIAMEYVQGSTLHQLIATEGPLKPEWVLSIGDTLADALETACQAGIIHRDLKPANILVRESDGVAKITDFGIARVNHSELTNAGMTYGSPAYMAPERIRGEQADLRSDLFSLGVILYEALCGKRPFGGDDFASICYAILNDPPASIRGRASGLSPAFDAFFATALAKDPAERFQTGAAFREALEAVRHQQVLYSSGAATMLMQHPVRSQIDGTQTGSYAGDTASGTSSVGGTTWTSGFNAVDEEEAPVLPRRPQVGLPSAEQRPYKRLLYLGSFGLLAVLLCLFLLQGGEAPGIESSAVNREADADAAAGNAQTEGSLDATAQAPAASTANPDGASAGVDRRASPSGPGVVKPPALEQRPRSLGGASPAATAPPKKSAQPVNIPRKGVSAASDPAPAKPRIEPAVVASVPAAAPPVVEAEPEPVVETPEAPVAAPPAPAVINLSIKSNVRAGKLELLAGERQVFSSPLDSEKKGFALAYRRVSGKGEPLLETQLEIPADTRRLTVRVWSEAKSRWFEDGLDLDLAPGEEVAVRITAGRALGSFLSITRD